MDGLIVGERVRYKSRSGEMVPDVVLAAPIREYGKEYVLLQVNGMVPADFCESTTRPKPEKVKPDYSRRTGRPALPKSIKATRPRGWPVQFKPSDFERVDPAPARASLPPLPGTPAYFWWGSWITAANILPA